MCCFAPCHSLSPSISGYGEFFFFRAKEVLQHHVYTMAMVELAECTTNFSDFFLQLLFVSFNFFRLIRLYMHVYLIFGRYIFRQLKALYLICLGFFYAQK